MLLSSRSAIIITLLSLLFLFSCAESEVDKAITDTAISKITSVKRVRGEVVDGVKIPVDSVTWGYQYNMHGKLTVVTEQTLYGENRFTFNFLNDFLLHVESNLPNYPQYWHLNTLGYVTEITYPDVVVEQFNAVFIYNDNGYLLAVANRYNEAITPPLYSYTLTCNNVTAINDHSGRWHYFLASDSINSGGIYQNKVDVWGDQWLSSTGLFGKPNQNLLISEKYFDQKVITNISYVYGEKGAIKQSIYITGDRYEAYSYQYQLFTINL